MTTATKAKPGTSNINGIMAQLDMVEDDIEEAVRYFEPLFRLLTDEHDGPLFDAECALEEALNRLRQAKVLLTLEEK